MNKCNLVPYQLGFVVNNLDEAILRWNALLGKTPDIIDRNFSPETHYVYGQERKITIHTATYRYAGVEVELTEPVDSPVHEEFLREKGEGLQHLGYKVSNYMETVAALESMGYPRAMQAEIHVGDIVVHASFFDTRAVSGVMTEIVAAESYEAATSTAESAEVFTAMSAIAMVVPDLDAAIRGWTDAVGIGPWSIYTLGSKRQTFKLAVCHRDDVALHLLQPLEGESCFKKFLDAHGGGIHHVAYRVAENISPQELQALFCKAGDGGFTFVPYTEDAGFTLYDGDNIFGYRILAEHAPLALPAPDDIYPSADWKPENPLFETVRQVCCGTDGAYDRVHACADLFGVKPWACMHFDPRHFLDSTTLQQNDFNEYDIGLCDRFGVQLEYTACKRPSGFQWDYFHANGSQLHHIAVSPESAQALVAALESIGGTVVSAEYVANVELSYFVDVQQQLGCIIQIPYPTSQGGDPDFDVWLYPEPPALSK